MTNLPVPSPRTFTVGETETAAYFNTVRDAENFLLNPPLYSGYQATTQSIGTGWSMAAIDQTTVDSYGGHSNVTNNSRYTAVVAGWYLCSGAVCFLNTAGGNRNAMFAVNGTRYLGSAADIGASGDYTTVAAPATPIFLNVGDYVELAAFTSVATSLYVGFADLRTRMNVKWAHA